MSGLRRVGRGVVGGWGGGNGGGKRRGRRNKVEAERSDFSRRSRWLADHTATRLTRLQPQKVEPALGSAKPKSCSVFAG